MSYTFHLEQADIILLGIRILVQFCGLRGPGLHQYFLEIGFLVVSDREE